VYVGEVEFRHAITGAVDDTQPVSFEL
jgi:hypothetical protein